MRSKNASSEIPPEKLVKTSEGWMNYKGVRWILSDHKNIQLRVLIATHTGMGGIGVGEQHWKQLKPISYGK
eukprot:IDg11550t1